MHRFVPAIGAFLASCALFATTATMSPAELSVEELQNGYFVKILTQRSVGDVTTLITPSNWLTITVTDTLLDTAMAARYRSPMVDSTLVRRFETATQFSLRFVKPVSSAEVFQEQDRRRILISVFFREQ